MRPIVKKVAFLSVALNFAFIFLSGYVIYKSESLGIISERLMSVFKPVVYKENSYYLQRKSLFETMPKNQGGIVFAGDSLIAGNDWREFLGRTNIVNRGVNGDTTSGLLNRTQEIIGQRPDKLFIMIGVNDLWRSAKISNIIVDYKLIVEKVKNESPQTTIYIQSVLPINSRYINTLKNSDIINLNNELKQIAKDQNVNYIDLHDAFCSQLEELDEKYTNDGVHLLGEGYKLWASEIDKYLK